MCQVNNESYLYLKKNIQRANTSFLYLNLDNYTLSMFMCNTAEKLLSRQKLHKCIENIFTLKLRYIIKTLTAGLTAMSPAAVCRVGCMNELGSRPDHRPEG